MEVWQIILYGFAAMLALRSLSGLMIRRYNQLVREQAIQDEQRLQEERAQAQEAAKAAKQSPPQKRNGRAA